MRKGSKDTNLLENNINLNKETETDKIKTTNVNILLNRVRLDKKKALNKRITVCLLLAATFSSIIIFLSF